MKTETLVCKECSTQFEAEVKQHRLFCSSKCFYIFRNRKNNYKSYKEDKFCLYCNSLLTNKRAKYCSHDCERLARAEQAIKTGKAGHKTIRNYLLRQNPKCSNCGISEWQGKPITLELEHKDGNYENNILSNVCLLCPNCHSQTNTFKIKNKGNGRYKRKERYRNGLSY